MRVSLLFVWPVLVVLLGLPTAVSGAEFSGYLTLTTDYVYRGVSSSDGDPAAQLGGDVSFANNFYAGLWASTVDISNGPTRQRDLELNYYLGYVHEASDDWTLGANLVAYTYPGTEGNVDYDFEEIGLTANYGDRIWFEYAYTPDLYHSGNSAWNASILAEWQLPRQVFLSAGIGHYDVSNLTGSDYEYWQIGLTRTFGNVGVDLRYHGTSDWVPVISNPARADDRVAFSVRLNF